MVECPNLTFQMLVGNQFPPREKTYAAGEKKTCKLQTKKDPNSAWVLNPGA